MTRQKLRKLLEDLCPYIPYEDARAVLDVVAQTKKSLPPSVSLWLTLTAHIRHRHTNYEQLLSEGYDREAARHFTLDETNAVLRKWGCSRHLQAEE